MRLTLSISLLAAVPLSSALTVPKLTLPNIVPDVLNTMRGLAKNLPASAFPTFSTITLEEAKKGKDLWDKPVLNETFLDEEISSVRLGGASAVSAASAACSANPPVRIEWKSYPTADRVAFIASIKCLMGKPASGKFAPAKNRYEDLVRLHQRSMPDVHGSAVFIIWHRYYLWTFEQVLRKECGFNRAMPWWDEAKDAGNYPASDMFSDDRYFGHAAVNADGSPICIKSGAFSGLTCNIGPGNSNTPHCLARAYSKSLTSQSNQNFVETCHARTSYADMASCQEYGPHAYGHNGIGGVMSDVSASPSDPLFWMHHSFVDHSYRSWQNRNIPVRTTTINGADKNGRSLNLNYVIGMGDIRPSVTLGQIINTLGGTQIGSETFCYRYNY